MENDRISEDARELALEVRRLAHDLNNTLMPILLASSSIRMTGGADSEKLAKKVDAIERSAKRASEIVTELQTAAHSVLPRDSEDKGAG